MDKVDLVYPLGPGSRDDNFEILYSLALVQKYMTGYRSIYIIGEQPPAAIYTNLFSSAAQVIHVPHGNTGINPQDNIRRKVLVACNHPHISDPFLFMNDDFFLRAPLHAATYPYYYFGNIALAYNLKRKQGHYKRALHNTIIALAARDLLLTYYDIHVPILYHKDKFVKAISGYDWSVKDGYVIKSLYGNTVLDDSVKRMPYTDCNINHHIDSTTQIESFIPPGRNIFAVGQNGLNDTMKEYIKAMR